MSTRLVLHIGIGKTGSTSIQSTLRNNKASLEAQGYRYLGLILEEGGRNTFGWRDASDVDTIEALPEQTRLDQLVAVFDAVLEDARRDSIHTLIWSNEWFFDRSDLVLPAIVEIKKRVPIQVVAYLRSHEKWIKSAYIQWGIKHKYYEGPILPFSQWLERQPLGFLSRLKPWMAADPQWLGLRNFDDKPDVVLDFLDMLGVDSREVGLVRENDRPSSVALALWALFNNQHNRRTAPQNCRPFLERSGLLVSEIRAVSLDELLPNAEDLERFRASVAGDIGEVNRLLSIAGEKPLDSAPCTDNDRTPSSLELIASLLNAAVKTDKRVRRLRRDLRKMENHAVPELQVNPLRQVIANLSAALHRLGDDNAEHGSPSVNVNELITQSGLFDAAFYLRYNPDVRAAAMAPLDHFVSCGAREGRNPGPLFDTNWYYTLVPGLRESGTNPIVHYMLKGLAFGLPPHPPAKGGDSLQVLQLLLSLSQRVLAACADLQGRATVEKAE